MKPLTPEEDEELRRLAALAEFGQLTPLAGALFRELRARDRRSEIREPRVVAVPVPRGTVDDDGDAPEALTEFEAAV